MQHGNKCREEGATGKKPPPSWLSMVQREGVHREADCYTWKPWWYAIPGTGPRYQVKRYNASSACFPQGFNSKVNSKVRMKHCLVPARFAASAMPHGHGLAVGLSDKIMHAHIARYCLQLQLSKAAQLGCVHAPLLRQDVGRFRRTRRWSRL